MVFKCFRTNLPKENMEFPGFPWKLDKSFVTTLDVIKYLLDYAEHYNINDHVKVRLMFLCYIYVSCCRTLHY